MSSQTARKYIMTASFAAITATGAWYGAGLKTRQEIKEEQQAVAEATPEERISQLAGRRAQLMAHRAELERKIERLTAKTERNARQASE